MAKVYIPKNQIKKIRFVYTKGGAKGSQIVARYPDACAVINAGLYARGAIPITSGEYDNVHVGYLGDDEGYGVLNDNELIWCTAKEAYERKDISQFLAGAPTLVKDRTVQLDWGNLESPYLNQKHVRSIMADNYKDLMLFTIDSSVTPKVAAERSVKYMYTDRAINLDGGGSCEVWVDGKCLKYSGRYNATWIVVWKK
jgi:hypothetical protein